MQAEQKNYVSLLNELSQKKAWTVEYQDVDVQGPDHIKTFTMRVVVKTNSGPRTYLHGSGRNKREAKQNAAKNAFNCLEKEEPDNSATTYCSSDSFAKMTQPNYTCWLNEYGQKNRLGFKAMEAIKSSDCNTQFCSYACHYVCDGKEFPQALGKGKKEAKEAAAKLVYEVLKEQKTVSSDQSTSPEDTSSQTPNIKPDDFNSSKNQNTSESVIFRDSSVTKPEIISPVSEHLSDIRTKRKLAPNFLYSPNRKKEEAPNMNAESLAKPSPKGNSSFNQSSTSRFLEEFCSITRIGKGGFGHVFRAKRKLEDTYFAVKIVKHTEKACREVNGLARLDHANIVRYHTSWIEETAYRDEASESSSTSDSGCGSEPKYLYIQMEFCEGKTLCMWIDDINSQPKQSTKRRQQAAKIMKQVLEAVKYVHSKNLFHRDLKPANIMIRHDGGVKVLDFGLVTAADSDNVGGLLERTNKTGTRSYMSPEQINQSFYDKKVDIFALGLIYFELLWHLGTTNEKSKIWDDIRSKDLPKMFHEKFGFEYKLIHQMLSKNPEERPDASFLASQLDDHKTLDHWAHRQYKTY